MRHLVSLRHMNKWAEQHTSSSIGGKNFDVSLMTYKIALGIMKFGHSMNLGSHKWSSLDGKGTNEEAGIKMIKIIMKELFERVEKIN